MIVTGDIHLNDDSEEIVFGSVFPTILEHALADDKRVMILGDLWHLRYVINARLQNRLRDTFLEWREKGIQAITIVPGNHDQIDVGGRNALEVLQGLGRGMVHVASSMCFGVGYYAPYRRYPSDWLDQMRGILESSVYVGIGAANPAILWAHVGIAGAEINGGLVDTDGIKIEEIQNLAQGSNNGKKAWDHIICGHYHKPQYVMGEQTMYVGSPWQVTANEAGQAKRLLRYDISTGTFMSLPVSCGRKIYQVRIDLGSMDKLDWLIKHAQAQDDVRITTASGVSTAEVGRKLIEAGLKHTVTPDIQLAEARLNVPADAGIEQFAAEYFKQKAGVLSKVSLARIFDQILGVGV